MITVLRKAPKLYDGNVAEIIGKYEEAGGYIVELKEGCLGYGLTVCYGENLKTCVITEVYLNSQSSGHKVRFYNDMPKKYKMLIEQKINNYDNELAAVNA